MGSKDSQQHEERLDGERDGACSWCVRLEAIVLWFGKRWVLMAGGAWGKGICSPLVMSWFTDPDLPSWFSGRVV